MPKMKTNKSAAKRFSKTKTGKIKRKRSNLRHILSTKSPSQKRRLRMPALVSESDKGKINRLLPYA